MKLKPSKDKTAMKDVFREMFSKRDTSSATSLTIDIDGGITLENFKKLIDYTSSKTIIETKHKLVYIYGNNLVITYCDKHYATACGDIERVEIFSKEV